jgi:hypothetical protein
MQPPKEKVSKQKQSTIEIINDYAKKTKHRIKDVKLIPNPTSSNHDYKMWVYADDFENELGITEERLHYLMIKRRWQEQYDWSDNRARKFGRMGITIPTVVYDFIQSRKNLVHEFVVCIINDVNRWKYTDIQNYYYYRISLRDMHEFAKKTYTIFKNQYNEEVIGFPFSLFKRI